MVLDVQVWSFVVVIYLAMVGFMALLLAASTRLTTVTAKMACKLCSHEVSKRHH